MEDPGAGPALRTLCLLAVLLAAPPAAARSLYWSSMEVTARLDADGRLHVEERQAMVFDGDWNGGERRFRLGVAGKLDLHRVTRIDPATGERTVLTEGDLDAVDRFAWHDGETLRWRSRLPTDPVFEEEEIVYLLEYTLSRVLRQRGDVYSLDHDFAFPDRPGSIQLFTLDLELDPVWEPTIPVEEHLEIEGLPPGESVRVTLDLAYRGSGRPGAVLAAVPLGLRLAAFSAALAAMAWLSLRFRRHEASRGRYGAAEVPPGLDRAWLEEHLFDLRPEEVGALWDGTVGPPEVAATLARLVAEGKLESSVREEKRWWRRKRILELELRVERRELEGYERELVDRLFFDGGTRTDTEAVAEHYKNRGFDPTGVIRGPVEKRLRRRLGRGPRRPKARIPWWLFLAFAVLMGLEWLTRGGSALPVLALLVVASLVPLLVGSSCVRPYRLRWRRNLPAASLVFVLNALALAAVCWVPVLPELHGVIVPTLLPGLFGVLALAVFPVWLLAAWLHSAATRDSKEVVRKRQELAEVRRRLAAELDQPSPALDDAWFPYLLAFGLDSQVDRWFASFGGEATSDHRRGMVTIGSSGGSGGSSSPSWTGGGGSFGGAGASAGWAAAAVGLGAGVARPSSSSGGSSGGGGSSSGGGGGGGW